jgi:xanthine/uracil permease
MMDRLARLQLVAGTAYYLGWIATILATLMHFAKMASFLTASPRNVLEASFLLFVTCMVYGIRAVALTNDNRMPSGKKLLPVITALQRLKPGKPGLG